jgi:hypothetical protein
MDQETLEKIKVIVKKWDKSSYGYAISHMDIHNPCGFYWDTTKKAKLIEVFFKLIPTKFDRINSFTDFKHIIL